VKKQKNSVLLAAVPNSIHPARGEKTERLFHVASVKKIFIFNLVFSKLRKTAYLIALENVEEMP